MQKDFKETIYSNYNSTHSQRLYGANSLEKIRRHFPAWNYYFSSILPLEKSASILDLGCGDGNFVYWLNSSGYVNARGVDISSQQINAGKSMGISAIEVSDIKTFLSTKKESFDFIVMRDVIEHFTRDEVFEILELVNASLKPGGSIMIQVPNGQGIFYTTIFFGDYTHEWAYSQSSINQIFLNCGFREIKCFEMGPAPVNLSGMIRLLFWKYKVMITRFWRFVESGNHTGIFSSNIIAVAKK